jgi:hypothetical protein
MRGLKSTFLLLGVLAGLVGYIYFVDSKKDTNADTREKALPTVAADAIEEIEIKAEDGERTSLRKTDGQWKITEPVSADADASELSSITNSLADISIERVVEENPADLQRFGLDPPRIEVSFRAKDGKEPQRLLVGDKTPTGSEVYARTPDKPRVFILASFLESTFNKNTLALRDKAILKFERDKVDSVELSSGKTALQFTKSGNEWRLAQPIAARADFGAVESILERIGSAQMQGITEQEASDLRKYGLDRPSATIVVGSGSSRATLLLGDTDNGVVFAKDASRPAIFTVAPTIKTDVFKEVGDLRRKDVFDSRSFNATRIELTRGSETMTFEKSKGKDDQDVWKKADGAEVDSAKMEDLLGKLLNLRAQSFASSAPASLRSPALTVNVRYEENKTETVRFGRSGDDVHASRADEPGAAQVEAKALDDAVAALDALK